MFEPWVDRSGRRPDRLLRGFGISVLNPLTPREALRWGIRSPGSGLEVSNPWIAHIPPGNLTYLWKITIFNGKIHYKMVMFNSYVSLPEGNPNKTNLELKVMVTHGDLGVCSRTHVLRKTLENHALGDLQFRHLSLGLSSNVCFFSVFPGEGYFSYVSPSASNP